MGEVTIDMLRVRLPRLIDGKIERSATVADLVSALKDVPGAFIQEAPMGDALSGRWSQVEFDAPPRYDWDGTPLKRRLVVPLGDDT